MSPLWLLLIGFWRSDGIRPSSRRLEFPINAPPITDIHNARRVNSTTPGSDSAAKVCWMQSLKLAPALPENSMANKIAFQAKQTSAESRAFDSPKHTPQKRLLANVVNGIRLKKRPSNGPTSTPANNARNRPEPNSQSFPSCHVY